LSPYKDSDEVSRVILWFRSLNRDRPEVIDDFNAKLSTEYPQEQIEEAENKVLEVARSLVSESTGQQLFVSSDSQFSEIVNNEIVGVSDLVNAAVFPLIQELLVVGYEDKEITEKLNASKFKHLVDIAKGKLSDLSRKEILEPALKKAKATLTTIEEEMKEAGVEVSYKNVENSWKHTPV